MPWLRRCVVSGQSPFSGLDGIDLSAGGRAGGSLGKANKNLKGDELKAAVDKQAWDESVKSLVGYPRRSFNDEYQTRVDAKAWRRGSCPAGRCHGRDSAFTIEGRCQRQVDSRPRSRKLPRNRSKASKSSLLSRPIPKRFTCPITIRRCVRKLALSSLSAILFPAARIYRRRSHRERSCVRCRLRAGALGFGRKLLGRGNQLGQ